jgi:hypothetical protein
LRGSHNWTIRPCLQMEKAATYSRKIWDGKLSPSVDTMSTWHTIARPNLMTPFALG